MIEQTLHDVYSDIKEKYQSRGLSPLKHLILSNTKQELVKKDGLSSNGRSIPTENNSIHGAEVAISDGSEAADQVILVCGDHKRMLLSGSISND